MEQQSPKCFIFGARNETPSVAAEKLVISGRWLERGEERRLRSPRLLPAVPKPRWVQGMALVGMGDGGPWHGMHPEGRTGGKQRAVEVLVVSSF
jgi:hypothetical protein